MLSDDAKDYQRLEAGQIVVDSGLKKTFVKRKPNSYREFGGVDEI